MLCTHPMFGPDSGAGSWAGLNLMFECVRVAQDPERLQRAANFLAVRTWPGCFMSCVSDTHRRGLGGSSPPCSLTAVAH